MSYCAPLYVAALQQTGRLCASANDIYGITVYVLKAMLAMEDTGALLRFVQRTNDVDLREGELALRTQGRYSELVALYQQRGQHEAALNLLHTLTLSPQDLPTPPSGQTLLLHR